MSKRPVHKVKSSSMWNGTVTAWCGFTARRADVERVWLSSTNCPGCLTAMARKGVKP